MENLTAYDVTTLVIVTALTAAVVFTPVKNAPKPDDVAKDPIRRFKISSNCDLIKSGAAVAIIEVEDLVKVGEVVEVMTPENELFIIGDVTVSNRIASRCVWLITIEC